MLLLAACPDGGDPCFVGVAGAPPELQVVMLQAGGGGYEVAADGGVAPLLMPPQGGKLIAPAVLARNVDGCGLQISAALRDPCDGKLVGLEQRPIDLRARDDGWAEPKDPVQLSNYSNLSVCPRANGMRDVNGAPYTLEVSVTDRDGRTAATSLTVVPTCAEADYLAQCECECGAGYVLGQSCEGRPDAGPTDGTCP